MTTRARHRLAVHPLQAALLAFDVPLYLGALLNDLAYGSTYEIQWSNFAAWLLAGAMVFTGLALAWSLVDLIRARPRKGRPLALFVLLLATFVLGLINCFVHARDAFGTMPGGLILSVIVTIIAVVAAWLGFSGAREEIAR